MIRWDEPLQIKDDIRFSRVEEEGVVLRQGEGEVLVVNEVGIRILELAQEGASPNRILAILEEEYDVEAGPLRKDVARFLEELTQAGVLGHGL